MYDAMNKPNEMIEMKWEKIFTPRWRMKSHECNEWNEMKWNGMKS